MCGLKTKLNHYLLLKSKLRIDSRGIAMHSENRRMDSASIYHPSDYADREEILLSKLAGYC